MNSHPVLNVVAFAPRRRNYFLSALRVAAQTRRIPLIIHGMDQDALDPFISECDLFSTISSLESEEGRVDAVRALGTHNALFFGWNDRDIRILSLLRQSIAKSSALALPNHEIVELMHDKLKTKQWAQRHALDVAAEITNYHAASPENKVVVKPRCGQGSVNVYVCKSPASVKVAIEEQTAEFIVEEFVSGTEFTIDVVCFDGDIIAAVPRRRIKVRGGEVLVAQVEMRSDLIELARKLCRFLGGSMVFNFQVIETSGQYKLIEMNPRFGGGSDLTIAAGLDLPGAYIDIFVLNVRPEHHGELRDGLVMSRRFESMFFMAVQ